MLVPTTVLGRWSVLGLVAFAAFIGVFAALVASGQRGGEHFFSNLLLAIPFLAAYLGAVMAFAFGAVAVASRGERALVVVAAAVVGFLVTAFGVLEVLFPH